MGAALVPMMLIGTLASAGVGIAGAITSKEGADVAAQGQLQQYQAQSANAAYQAQVAQNNSVIAGRNANMDLQAGETAVTNRGLKTRAEVGKTLAGQGASGVDVNSGSFVGARSAVSQVGALDALTMRSDTAKKLYADETQQSNYEAESGLLTQESKEASAAGPVAAEGTELAGTGSMLSSASSVGSGLFKYMQTTG